MTQKFKKNDCFKFSWKFYAAILFLRKYYLFYKFKNSALKIQNFRKTITIPVELEQAEIWSNKANKFNPKLLKFLWG